MGWRRPTARGSSPGTSRSGQPPPCCGSRMRATRTSARRTCTSSRTGRPPRTRTSATSRIRAFPAASPAARAGAPRRRVAAGLADAALGTDSAGSIRIPAACCGLVGHKPTHGLVALDGCWPLAASFDTGGPLAQDVEGCERMLGALVPGFEPVELESLEELEVGVAWTELADPLVRERVEAAAAQLPATARGRVAGRSRRRLTRSSCERSPTSTASSSRRTPTCTAKTFASRSKSASRCATARSSAPRRLRARVPRAGRDGTRRPRPGPHADAPDRRAASAVEASGRATWTCANP